MEEENRQLQAALSSDEIAVRALYKAVLDGWNKREAAAFAAPFAEDGAVIGFDGSQYASRAETQENLQRIFADHLTGSYVSIVRSVSFLAADVALLRAVAGMTPHGQSEINPALNALQTLIAVRAGNTWQIVLFQNTPAQFHGRPELAQQLTDELRQLSS